MPPTVLICPKVLDHTAGEHFDVLVGAGFSVRYAKPVRDLLTAEELSANLDKVDAVIAGSEPYTAKVLAQFPSIRVISRVGVGYDSVDVAAATERGVAVAITPGANHDSVAELTFALMLAHYKRLIPSQAMMVSGGFDRKMTHPLRGKTIGLVGYGRIGQAVARLAHAFQMRVIYHDPVASVPAGDTSDAVALDDLWKQSDIISLHAPLLPETRHLVRKETIAKMKTGALIINTARGALINEADLAEGLKSGRVGGAGLDVFEREPPTGSPILTAPRVVMTPHVGGIDEEGVRQMALMACQSVVDLYQGRFPTERIVNGTELGPWTWAKDST
ncbi:phosphoglycerate dehydrogenase [bacterium]|nr:phosphoglycerate dehydrogenase [bacterium]